MGVDTLTMLCWFTSRKKACVGLSCRRRLWGQEACQVRRPPAEGLGDPPKMVLNLHFSSTTARALALTSLESSLQPDLDLSQPPRTGWVSYLSGPLAPLHPFRVEPGPYPTQGLREAAHAPDDLDQLAHVNMVWDQKLGFVQDRQLFLTLVAFDDHLEA